MKLFDSFIAKFEQLLASMSAKYKNFIVMRDFNIDLLVPSSNLSEPSYLIHSFNMHILITEIARPTTKIHLNNILFNIDDDVLIILQKKNSAMSIFVLNICFHLRYIHP